jgi:hypothetical protein|tara:strand:- start:67 stop:186 length:120 start_codon:yes stop_codon:yes gene_type:complete
MKLRKIKIGNKITYTLKDKYENKKTEEAHYKFIQPKTSN